VRAKSTGFNQKPFFNSTQTMDSSSKPITLWVLKYKRNKSAHWNDDQQVIWSYPSSSFVGALRNLVNQIGEPVNGHSGGGVIITKAHWDATIEIFKVQRVNMDDG
jgi:hypothetical protein